MMRCSSASRKLQLNVVQPYMQCAIGFVIKLARFFQGSFLKQSLTRSVVVQHSLYVMWTFA